MPRQNLHVAPANAWRTPGPITTSICWWSSLSLQLDQSEDSAPQRTLAYFSPKTLMPSYL